MKVKLYSKYDTNTPMLNRVLVNRGVPINELRHYMNTTDEDINDPELLCPVLLRAGVDVIIDCVEKNEKCLIVVDSDCDGYTSAAILINYLYKHYPDWVENNVSWFIHSGKQHGLSDCIEEALKYNLVICPDSASNDYEFHTILKNQNIPCLILDHHEADKLTEDAILINNQMVNYPNKDFSGAGITWQFCRFMDKVCNTNYANDFIDLCALGNCGDMMSMLSIETKHIINKGFEPTNIKNPFIYNMWKKNEYKLGQHITSMGAAFYIVPFVNATVRSGTQEEKEIVFQSMLSHRAFKQIPSTKRGHAEGEMETVVTQAVRQVTNIKNRQTKAQDAAMAFFEKQIKDNCMMEHKVLLFLVEPGQVDKNIAGLIANKLMAKYQRPCCILTRVVEMTGGEMLPLEDGCPEVKYAPTKMIISYQGSARGCDKVGVTEFKDICANTGYTMYTAGHQGAFGLGILEDQIAEYVVATDEALVDISDEPIYYVDHIYHNCDVDPQSILDIAECAELWGSRMEEPFMEIEGLKVSADMVDVYRKATNTIKITLPNKVALIKFNATEEECDMLTGDGFVELNIIGQCRKNEWNGFVTPQMEVIDWEVANKMKYYF